jgi:hypothetical protein
MPQQRSGSTLQAHGERRTVTSSDGTSLVVERVTAASATC